MQDTVRLMGVCKRQVFSSIFLVFKFQQILASKIQHFLLAFDTRGLLPGLFITFYYKKGNSSVSAQKQGAYENENP